MGEMARGIAPVLVRAKECLDEWDERPSDHTHARSEITMLSMTEKIQLTMNNLEGVYEQTTKGVKTIFHRECMLELFLSMLQEWVKEGGAYV